MRHALLLAAVLASASAAPAHACSCRCQGDAEALARGVPIFFRGRPTGDAIEGDVRRYTFEVSAVLKGEPARRTMTVTTAAHGAACGAQFDMQRDTLVGAFPHKAGWSANSCTQWCIGQKRDEVERLLARCTPGAPCPPRR